MSDGTASGMTATLLEWGYAFFDSPRSVFPCSEEAARAKASLDWSVIVVCRARSQTTSGEWVAVRAERPDGSVS